MNIVKLMKQASQMKELMATMQDDGRREGRRLTYEVREISANFTLFRQSAL